MVQNAQSATLNLLNEDNSYVKIGGHLILVFYYLHSISLQVKLMYLSLVPTFLGKFSRGIPLGQFDERYVTK